jgi:hypothetical protein
MYTTTIGKIFLDAYNDKYKRNYSAKGFFLDVFVPLFFDHNKYMMTGGNSPLENPKLSWDEMIKGTKPYQSPTERTNRIDSIVLKIESKPLEMSTAIGFGVADLTNPSASQISNVAIPSDTNLGYLSWIGAGFGITVAGGYSILFQNKQILLDIFEGWGVYRQYLENYPMLKGNQINSWNGLWLQHKYSRDYDPEFPSAGMNPTSPLEGGLLNIKTPQWLDVLWGISMKDDNPKEIGYIYKIGQSNSTIGFIPFDLFDIKKPCVFWERLFGTPSQEIINRMKILYGTKKGFEEAICNGSIGIKALIPKDLVSYIPRRDKESRKINLNNDKDEISFKIYLIWIIAMLNNEQMWDLSQNFAKDLLNFEEGAAKARRDRTNNVTKLLEESSSVRLFFENIIDIVKDADSTLKDKLNQICKMVNEMPRDNYPYFITLVKFQYAIQNK